MLVCLCFVIARFPLDENEKEKEEVEEVAAQLPIEGQPQNEEEEVCCKQRGDLTCLFHRWSSHMGPI